MLENSVATGKRKVEGKKTVHAQDALAGKCVSQGVWVKKNENFMDIL